MNSSLKAGALLACVVLASCIEGSEVVVRDTDMLALCNPYGGLARVIGKDESVNTVKRKTSVTVECGDGSWISRSVEHRL